MPSYEEWKSAALLSGVQTGYILDIAWCDQNSGNKIHNVDEVPNIYKYKDQGINNMLGNVWEWCEDWSSEECVERIICGGSWDYHCDFCHYDFNMGNMPYNRDVNQGFRLALSIPYQE